MTLIQQAAREIDRLAAALAAQSTDRTLPRSLLGGLKKEGPVPLLASMTVLQAINAAGGLTEYAKRKKIYILRNENGQQMRIPFDYQAVIRGERMEQNVLLRPDDTIVVPQ